MKLRSFRLHPILMALFFPLALFSYNLSELPNPWTTDLPWILLGSLCFVALAMALLPRILRHKEKADLLITLGVVWFYSYGHTRELVGPQIGRAIVLFPVWVGVGWFLIRWTIRNPDVTKVSRFLTVASLWLMLSTAVVVVKNYPASHSKSDGISVATASSASGSYPDIYYIILDMYGGIDTLRDYYQYDNEPFYSTLEQMGFFVGRQSHSNYGHTITSLASSLNGSYINHDIDDNPAKRRAAHVPLYSKIENNWVASFLKRKGYRHIVYKSPVVRENTTADKIIDCGRVDPFKQLWIRTSALVSISKIEDSLGLNARKVIDCNFSTLEALADEPGPKFVFAHFFLPHPPFVFGPNGEVVGNKMVDEDPEFLKRQSGDYFTSFKTAYLNQLIYANKRTGALLKGLLQRSQSQPIIIVQGDHGPHFGPGYSNWRQKENGEAIKERFGILNAIYGPSLLLSKFMPDSTPVNTFRILFNTVFGEKMEILENRQFYTYYLDDRSWAYNSQLSGPFFIDVTEHLPTIHRSRISFN